MIKFGVFSQDDNTLLRTGACAPQDLDSQAGPGEVVREGDFTFQPPAPPIYSARGARARSYPPIGDQLGAIADLVRELEKSGFKLPPSTSEWLAEISRVKAANPKDEA